MNNESKRILKEMIKALIEVIFQNFFLEGLRKAWEFSVRITGASA
jgi:hypothetical protein